MKKIICILLVVVTMTLSGCMGLNISQRDITLSTYNSSISIGSMNEKYVDALRLVSEDALVSFFENNSTEEFYDDFRTISEEDHDFIFVPSPLALPVVSECANDFPDKQFAITDVYDIPKMDNVTNIVYKYNEGAYLAGYIAGKTAKAKKLGILCQEDNMITAAMIHAYMAGAITAGGNIEFETSYIGNEYNNNAAYDATIALYDNGCEIVFQNLLNPDGAINAAEVAEKYIIGVGVDQSTKSASRVLTTIVINYDIALSKVLNKYIEDESSVKGETFEFGLADYVVSLSKTTTHIDKDVFSQVSKLKESIITGSLKVPYTPEEVEKLREEAINNPPVEEEAEETEETEEATKE